MESEVAIQTAKEEMKDVMEEMTERSEEAGVHDPPSVSQELKTVKKKLQSQRRAALSRARKLNFVSDHSGKIWTSQRLIARSSYAGVKYARRAENAVRDRHKSRVIASHRNLGSGWRAACKLTDRYVIDLMESTGYEGNYVNFRAFTDYFIHLHVHELGGKYVDPTCWDESTKTLRFNVFGPQADGTPCLAGESWFIVSAAFSFLPSGPDFTRLLGLTPKP